MKNSKPIDTSSLIEYYGYQVEEHEAITIDGYHIGLQRIKTTSTKPIIIWHGLSTCSEMFVCDKESIAFVLADQGYDVWLANARGSKYSAKHSHLSLSDRKYWEFSMDDYATKDVPTVVDYILNETNSKKLSYLGFSQGSAQIFAALSLCEDLNYKINHVFALAPAMKPKQIENEYLVKLLSRYGPRVLYSILGRKAFLPIAQHMKTFAPDSLNRVVVKGAMKFLLNWKLDKFGDVNRQSVLFQNVFSTTSMRSIVHWFQIIENEKFTTYDCDDQKGLTCVVQKTRPVSFPTKHIKTKMTLFCGGQDNLSDPEFMLKSLNDDVEYVHVDVFDFD